MAATAGRPRSGRWQRGLGAWRQWQHSRPFWGALFVLVGGAEILLTQAAPLPLIIHIGLQGVAGYLVPLVLVVTGLLLLFHPVQRTFYSLLAIILALGSWITSNLGGFFLGMLIGVIGGSLAFAWQPRFQFDQEERRGKPQPKHRASIGLALIKGEHPADDGPANAGPPDVRTADPGPPDPGPANRRSANDGRADYRDLGGQSVATRSMSAIPRSRWHRCFDADDTRLTIVTMMVAAAVPAVTHHVLTKFSR